MKRNVIIGLMATLAICGCQVKEEGEFAPEGKVFMATTEAYIADGVDTKTSLDAGGSVLWKMGDQVSIFAGSTINEHYQVTDASDGKTAAALNRVESPGFVAGGDIDNNVAFYPYAEMAELAKNGNAYVIRDIALPATQTYAQASFGNGAFPMTAVTSSTRDYNLKFKNVLGGLKLQLKGTATIASISITGNNNEVLCGDAVVDVSTTSAPSISLTDATAKTVTLDCGNGVQLNETTATAFIIALPPMTMTGGFTVTVSDTQGASMEIKTTKTQTITRSNLLVMPAVNFVGTQISQGPEAVDLGLPSGLKWASCNVGATAPEEYGDYFAWGETEPYYTEGHSQDSPCNNWKANKTGYDWTSYKWCNGSYTTQTKYCTRSDYGTIDNKTVLDPEDDSASVNWSGTWRMPTDAEWSELIDECTWTWTTQNGVNGRLVIGSNGNSIFLPAAGTWYSSLGSVGSYGRYWSSSLPTDNPFDACSVYFTSDNVNRFSGYPRRGGFSVRPVTDEGVRVSVTGITLNKSSLTLVADETEPIIATVEPSNATQPAVIWSSSNTSVATVEYPGVVIAESEGFATITATTYDGGHTVSCEVTVSPYQQQIHDGEVNGHYYVDLGLSSGLKWATCNVGATAPKEYGDYFAWGEVEPYYSSQNPLTWKSGKSEGYDWPSYQWCNGSDTTLTKYNYSSWSGTFGTIDNKTILDPEDDAAYVNWGGTWRMPTDEEWLELIEECTWTWTSLGGKKGYKVAGPNGNSIFLPAAGYRYETDLEHMGSGSYNRYWSSSLGTPNCPMFAFYMVFRSNSDGAGRSRNYRSNGCSVRPVSDEGVRVSVTGISLDKSSISLIFRETATITATVSPANATQKNVIWSSSDTSVATVSWEGVVTAVSAGTATIIATAGDGGSVATCTVVVPDPFYKEHYQGKNLPQTYGVCDVTQISDLPDAEWIPAGVTVEDLVGLKIEGDIFFGGDTFLIWINTRDFTLIIPDQVICPNFKFSSYGTYDGALTDGEGEVDPLNEILTFHMHSIWGPHSFGDDEITIYFGDVN